MAIPFYWGFIFDVDHVLSNYLYALTPLVCSIPLVLLSLEFTLDAITFGINYWYVPTICSIVYLFIDLVHSFVFNENLVSYFQWNNKYTYLYAMVFVALQAGVYFLLSGISSLKTSASGVSIK